MVNEIEAAYGGYHAQGVQPFAVQDCDPVYKDLYVMHTEYWQSCFEALRVGMTVREVNAFCASKAAKLLPSWSRYRDIRGQLLMHGRGLGSDGPLVTGHADETTFNQVLASGWVFIFKPTLSFDADGRRYSGGWGDTVVLSVDGPRRLGSRPPGLVFTGETN